MIRRAKERCAGQGEFYIADLAAPLPAEFGTFDGIICSLTLHYLKDWAVPLRSFTSALDAGGWIVISLDHPLGTPRPDRGNYFETTLVSGRWHKQGVSVTQRFWRRPLAAVVDAFAEAGLYIEKVAEPRPNRAALDRWPAELANADASPAFLLYRLRVRK
jgi:SAM-dependent methyltransferase